MWLTGLGYMGCRENTNDPVDRFFSADTSDLISSRIFLIEKKQVVQMVS